MAEADRSQSGSKQQSSDKQSEQEERIAKLELNLAEASIPPDLGPPPGPGRMPVKKDDPVKDDPVEEAEEEKFTGSREETGNSVLHSGDGEDGLSENHAEDDIPGPVSNNGSAGESGDTENEHLETPKEVKAEGGDGESREPVRQPRQAAQPEDDLVETDMGSRFDHAEEGPISNCHHGSGSPVFDEYFELMEIAEGPQLSGLTPAGSPIDLNLVASLVRWASIAKHRVGEERLRGVLELYFQSRPISPSLKDLLNQITEMADALPGEEEQTAQVCVDLISHLHGILTGGLPVGQVSQVALPTKG